MIDTIINSICWTLLIISTIGLVWAIRKLIMSFQEVKEIKK